jgi:hypothetical protein
MKHKILTFIFGGGVVILLMASSGAPVGSTGAHGELTCGKAGCHTGNNGANNINTGNGILSITSRQNITNYTPGEIYNITVALEEAGVERFGFSLTALDENNNKVGTLMVTDQQRTQIFQGANQYTGREYMTYRMVGTNPYEPGKGLWTFQWKAPDQPVGKITFYAAGVSANNDATDKGDLVYTRTLISEGEMLSTNLLQQNDLSFTVFPNPAKDYMQVRLSCPVDEPLSFSLYDMEGKLISSLPDRNVSVDKTTYSFSLQELQKGVYMLSMGNRSFSTTKKIIISH